MTGRARRQQRKRAWPIAVPHVVGPPPFGHVSADARRALDEFAEEFRQSLMVENNAFGRAHVLFAAARELDGWCDLVLRDVVRD